MVHDVFDFYVFCPFFACCSLTNTNKIQGNIQTNTAFFNNAGYFDNLSIENLSNPCT